MNRIKYFLVALVLTTLLTSCGPFTNTETVVSYNKFKNTTSIRNSDNYVIKHTRKLKIAFDVWYTKGEDEEVSEPRICGIKIKTESCTPVRIGEGCHIWIFADEKKIDLTCLSYEGTKRTSVYVSNAYTSTQETCYETAFFAADLEVISEIAYAQELTFEIENNSGKPIQGVFSEKNFEALQNFVEKVSSL